MGHIFSLVLSRVISDDESAILRDKGCACAVFGTDSLPTNAEVTVTKMDFDDTVSPSLAEAIESALEAVKEVPDLTVPGLTVPAVVQAPDPQPEAPQPEAEPGVLEGVVVQETPAKKAARKPRTKKATASSNGNGNGHAAANGSDDRAEVTAGSA